jgi:hypothetical protein
MRHNERRVLSLSIITLLTACAAETGTGERAPEKEPLGALAGDAAAPGPDAEADEALKARLDELAAQQGGPVNDAFFGNLGSQLFSPLVPNASTSGQSNSFQPSCGLSDATPDAAYTWTAPTTGRYIFSTANSYFDTILEVRPFNNSSVSLGGNGDDETLADFVNAGQACANPTAIECQTLSGVPASSTGEVYGCLTSVGGYCRANEQPEGACLDDRVRFLCP